MDPPLIASLLLQTEGSILGLHLTNQHLLVMNASSTANGIAAAVWYNSNTLELVSRLALPSDVCHVWAEYGLQKALISAHSGDLFTVPVQPEVSLSCWQ